MPRTGLWLRVFVGLLVAVMPPLLMLVGALLLSESVLAAASPDMVAVLVVGGATVWAGLLAIVFTRSLSEEFGSFVSLAQGGHEGESEFDAAYRRLAGLLDERNRQVSALAQEASTVPIDDEPRAVVASLVSAVRHVMRDPTWRCAVLDSDSPGLLPAGVYHGAEDDRAPDDVSDLERWASVTRAESPARHVEGPWGAFAVVELAGSERLRAILYAPWEGRLEPTPAETDLLTLVGQHAGTALEHSLLYAQVRFQTDELNRLAEVQRDFLRGVSHDLQTPLTSIGGLAEEMRADEQVPASARADLESIAHQAERLRRLVGQLLVASRIEAGVFTPRQEVFAISPIVERTWAALRADRPFELTKDGPAQLAVGDPDRLEQVMWALLDNAVKYSPEASPISVIIRPEGARLSITVRDEGMGMDDETREHAFEQFYRSSSARRLAPNGSGVGLYASRGLMEAMGGTIHIDSQTGGGTAITLHVPAESAEPDSD